MNRPLLPLIVPQPLTPAAFAPYGEVIAHQGTDRRHRLTEPLRPNEAAPRLACWVSRIDQVTPLPLQVSLMERHPFGAQTFVPLTPHPYLVVVAPPDTPDCPDMSRLEVFLASGEQGVCYRTGVWHHGLTVLAAPAEFLVLMARTGRDDDDEFWSVPADQRRWVAAPAR